MNQQNRRQFLKRIAAATGGVALAPYAVSCGSKAPQSASAAGSARAGAPADDQAVVDASSAPPAPCAPPAGFDPIAFNKDRGNAGAVPESYLDDINGPDGESKHLGKHLPYVPEIDPSLVPEGYLAIMWGDPDEGHTRHPSSPEGDPSYPRGHWYNWVRLRKAVEGDAEEVESTFDAWPADPDGGFVALGGGELTADGGKNTVYLVKLPSDVEPGDEIRVYGHCLYHGEYVDFLIL
ncbi:MAG: twin-arginine translocation signal domain-containing protein [Polyangia bacterium]